MIKGIHLTLLVGNGRPMPVPQEVLDALTNVQITTASGRASGFQLSFSISTQSPLQTIFLIAGGVMPPILRVVLVVTVNGISDVLMDGVVTNVEVSPGIEKGHTTLTVTGSDLTAIMNYADFSGTPYPAMSPEVRVSIILAKYMVLGILPRVIPSLMLDVPIVVQEIPHHQGKDLEYIMALADRVGYVFYVEPSHVPGISIAYWGPELKIGDPQPALNTNMDAFTNVESLTFSLDAEKKIYPVLLVQEPIWKTVLPIPVPDITPLNPPLGLIPPFPKKIEFFSDVANLSTLRATAIALAKAAQSSDAVFGSGSLDVLRYGRVLKARRLVGVRGAGTAFDGLYYVTEVTHKIQRGQYKQEFKLARNALVANTHQLYS